MIYFTSDTHFAHINMLKYDNRPFHDIGEHDQELIRRWNLLVDPRDTVYHLGDVTWSPRNIEYLLERLNGKKHLIWGNHDSNRVRRAKGWAHSSSYEEISVNGQKLCLFHYPMSVWNCSHHGSWHLHGHCHGRLAPDPTKKRLDMGTMCWAYSPVSFDEIYTRLIT